MPRLMKDESEAQDYQRMLQILKDYRRFEEIKIYSNDHRYSHENTMSLSDSVDFSCLLDEDNMANENVSPDDIRRWESVWNKFVIKLGRDMRNLSRSICHQAYELLDAFSSETKQVGQWKTRYFSVTISEKPAEVDDTFDEFHDDDFSLDDENLRGMLNGALRYVTLEAVVIQRGTKRSPAEVVLGSAVVSTITQANDPTYSGMRREIVSQAIQDARLHVADSIAAFSSFKAA